MTDSRSKEVRKFQDWATTYPVDTRSGEWECDYEHWSELNSAFADHLAVHQPSDATGDELVNLVYAVARDNEMEELIDLLVEHTKWFRRLLPVAIRGNENDAKWQFAVALGKGALPFDETEPLLLQLVEDGNEYVSRMALQSLGKIGSNHTEAYCERAWETNHEYQRIMVLSVLREIGSDKLQKYIASAREDGRKYLLQNAHEIENA